MKLYLDTSVLGAYYDKEFDEDTVKLFEYIAREDIKVVLSDILLEELQEAPENVRNLLNTIHNITYVEIDAETKALAKMYVKEGALEKKSLNDACHIAIATVTRTQVIVSCNFKHRSNSSKSSYIIALTYGKGTE